MVPQPYQLRNFAIWFSLALAASYFFIEATLPAAINSTSTLALAVAQLAAIFVCMYTAQAESPATKFRWYLLALSTAFRFLGLLYWAIDLPDAASHRYLVDLPRMFLYLGSACLLVSITGSFRREDPRIIKFLDWGMAVLLGSLLFTFVLSDQIHFASAHFAILALDAIRSFIGISAIVQWIASEGRSERRFFYVAIVIKWIGGTITTIHNHIPSLSSLPRIDFGIILPYLLLICVVLWPVPRRIREIRLPSNATRIGQITGPGLMSLAIILFAFGLSSIHFYVALAAGVIAVVIYAVRNGIIQSKLLETEEMLHLTRQELDAIFLRDSLTGISSRKAFYAAFFAEWKIAVRTRSPLSLLLIEIDHFRLMNNTHGRLLGDHCLVHVAVTLQQLLSKGSDFLSRFQGDQFAVLLPYTDDQGAMIVAEKVQSAIDQSPKARLGVLKRPITVSIGVSTVRDISSAWSELALIEAAERALSEARAEGHDCSRFAEFIASPRNANTLMDDNEIDDYLLDAYSRERERQLPLD